MVASFDTPKMHRHTDCVPEGWLTVSEAAERKGLEPQQVRDLIRAGRLHAEKAGPIWLIRVEDIDALVWHGPGRPKKRRGRPPKK